MIELIGISLLNSLRIINTYFKQPIQQKITWADNRARSFMIAYIIMNREIHPRNIIDIRTLSPADIGSGHALVLAKINLTITPEINTKTKHT